MRINAVFIFAECEYEYMNILFTRINGIFIFAFILFILCILSALILSPVQR